MIIRRLASKGRAACISIGLCWIFTIHSALASQYLEITAEVELNDWSYWFFEDRVRYEKEIDLESRATLFRPPITVRLIVGTNIWLMEGPFIRNGVVTRIFTGSNIVESTHITSQPPGPPENVAKGLRLAATAPPVGARYGRTIETSDGNPGRPVRVEDLFPDASGKVCWLAFCSGQALKGDGRRVPLPGALWKQYFSGDDFTESTRTFPDVLGLPRAIEVFTSDNQHLFNYQVRTSTNVLGWNIPLEFYLIQYLPSGRPPGVSWQTHLTAKGRVTAIGPSQEPKMPTRE